MDGLIDQPNHGLDLDLTLVKEEYEVEEHDLLQNPKLLEVFPDLRVLEKKLQNLERAEEEAWERVVTPDLSLVKVEIHEEDEDVEYDPLQHSGSEDNNPETKEVNKEVNQQSEESCHAPIKPSEVKVTSQPKISNQNDKTVDASPVKRVRIRKLYEKRFKCDWCEYRTAKNSDMQKHIIVHIGEKPFQCDVCDYRCSLKENLKRHAKIHTGEKPFKCDLCEYRCLRNIDLKKHSSVHTGEKPYKCDHCEYGSASSANYKRHIQTHTNEKRFQCERCEYKCAARYRLNKHLLTHDRPKKTKRSSTSVFESSL